MFSTTGKPKIIFIGTPKFGAIILDGLIQDNFKPVLVVTAPDKPVGRKQILTPSPVKVLAEKYKISVLQPKKLLTAIKELSAVNPDLIIVAAYGQILLKRILEIPKYGSLNLHPSLLPRWRGASPIQSTILAGDKETGTTIILMDKKMDHGPIIAGEKLSIKNEKWTYRKLEEELANLGAKLLIKTIPKWIKEEIKPAIQDEACATYTKIIKKEDGRIDWEKPAQEIERKIRAFEKWPGSFCFWPKNSQNIRLKILKADTLIQSFHGPFGVLGKTFQASNNKIAVQAGKDFLIVEELQPESKKPQRSEDFLRGYPDFIGIILE